MLHVFDTHFIVHDLLKVHPLKMACPFCESRAASPRRAGRPLSLTHCMLRMPPRGTVPCCLARSCPCWPRLLGAALCSQVLQICPPFSTRKSWRRSRSRWMSSVHVRLAVPRASSDGPPPAPAATRPDPTSTCSTSDFTLTTKSEFSGRCHAAHVVEYTLQTASGRAVAALPEVRVHRERRGRVREVLQCRLPQWCAECTRACASASTALTRATAAHHPHVSSLLLPEHVCRRPDPPRRRRPTCRSAITRLTAKTRPYNRGVEIYWKLNSCQLSLS